ncbi:coproporphyrinogen III oxidase [Halalkalibacterium halodurans]|jgi:oxygen-independent coproporphyrinogen-3 oxidase|uniref:Coproporphyrinogen III oxidase n=1 Tax=Halalkalibacterium halodurans TaxID=86665 RepID=A0A0M0KLS3_ALKHA|nr:coproporphyrinogen III oxidase [Halalkalibacterium halodurans]TPE70802.1 coproporphyrinogen III oxidase [Halalkalibacterium halodurans]
MNVSIHGLDRHYEQQITHLAQLFIEEPEILWGEQEADLHVSFELLSNLKARASLRHASLEQPLTTLFSYPEWSMFDRADEQKLMKRVLNYLFFDVMEQWSGLKQPWGVLTGVRPTKLMHQMRRAGLNREQIRKELKDLYRVSEEKVGLLERIVERQLAVLPDLDELDRGVSVYIGIPFCPTKCAYCTFPAYAINGKNGSVEAFLAGLHYEIEATGKWLTDHQIPVTTVYFGGGTPTSITAEQMDALYETLYDSFPAMNQVRELTVEAGRPDTITPEKIEVLKKWNVDRISINPQSFENETLQAIGRHHSVEETIEKYKMARDLGMENINMDLIIGLPGEGPKEMARSLEETEKLMPESLTVHTLSFKRASTMTKNRDKYKVATRDEIAEMMAMTSSWTEDHEYAPYYLYRQKNILGNLENVGYALPEKESLYNIVIMEEVQTIIGLGCGATSKWVEPGTGNISRHANPKDPRTYNERFKQYTEEKLDKLNELFQYATK